MTRSALTLNQKPILPSTPPNGLETLPSARAPGCSDTENWAGAADASSCESRRRASSVTSSEPIQTRRTWSIESNCASALSCAVVQLPDSISFGPGNPSWPWARNCRTASASGAFLPTALFTMASNCSKGTSMGIVAKLAEVSAESESGGVSAGAETEMRVQRRSDLA